MAPKGRPKARRIPNESDYDTDGLATDVAQGQYSDKTVTAPALQPRSNEELNLSVLKRQYPDISQILSVAPFAVVYAFSPESQSWEKTGVEGTLFVCQLSPEQTGRSVLERYSVVVLNRKGLFNYATELISSNNVEVTAEYVILQDTDNATQVESVTGLWIFSEPEPSSTARTREINAQIIVECATRAEKSRSIAKEDVNTGGGLAYAAPARPQDYGMPPQVTNPPSQSHGYTPAHAHGHPVNQGPPPIQHQSRYQQFPNSNGQQHMGPMNHPHGHYNPMQRPPSNQPFPQQSTHHLMGQPFPQQTMPRHYPPPHGHMQAPPPQMPHPEAVQQQYTMQFPAQAQPLPPSQPNVLLSLFQNAQRG